MPGWLTNGLPLVSPANGYPRLSGYAQIPADTMTEEGAPPQSVAITPTDIAGIAMAMASNTGTTSSGAVTVSKKFGNITTESLGTAAGGTFSITLTNTLIKATSQVNAAAQLGTATAGDPEITSITPAAGSATIVITNFGTAAFNGTLLVPFSVETPGVV